MRYQTLLLHVDGSAPCDRRCALAAALAKAHDAHLVGAAMTGISRYLFAGSGVDPRDPVLAHHVSHLHERAQSALDKFAQAAAAAGAMKIETRLVDDDATGGITLQSRYADLVVIGQYDPASAVPGLLHDFPETVLLGSPRPVLVVPYAGDAVEAFRRPMIAWDGSIPAARAVAGALPLLAHAGRADVVVFNPGDAAEPHGEQPGADLALYLSRHGIDVDVTERRVEGGTGEALLSMAADLDADLMVAGAYGHTRLREMMLGGVTRTLLQAMTLPVLMAH